ILISCVHSYAHAVIYSLSLHDALPILSCRCAESCCRRKIDRRMAGQTRQDRTGLEAARTHPGRTSTDMGGRPTSQIRRCRQNTRSEEHTSELQSRVDLVCRLLLEKKKK